MLTSKVCIFHPTPKKMVCKVSPGLQYTYTSLCGMWCCLGLQRLCGRRGRHQGEGITLQYPGCLDTERKSSDIRASNALGVLSMGGGAFRRRLPKFPTASSSKATLTTAQTNKVINKSDLVTFCMKSCWAIVGRRTNVLAIFTDLTFLCARAEVLWPPSEPSHSFSTVTVYFDRPYCRNWIQRDYAESPVLEASEGGPSLSPVLWLEEESQCRTEL